VICLSETSIDFQRTTRCYIAEVKEIITFCSIPQHSTRDVFPDQNKNIRVCDDNLLREEALNFASISVVSELTTAGNGQGKAVSGLN
jgi:hypothetical protein